MASEKKVHKMKSHKKSLIAALIALLLSVALGVVFITGSANADPARAKVRWTLSASTSPHTRSAQADMRRRQPRTAR
jgi:hypothetical protein